LSPASRGKFNETPDTTVWTGLTGMKILTAVSGTNKAPSLRRREGVWG